MLRVKLSNKHLLEMYYSNVSGLINVNDISLIFGCKYKASAKVRDSIKDQLNDVKMPVGYVPFDKVLEYANTSIEAIERSYRKQVQLKIGG